MFSYWDMCGISTSVDDEIALFAHTVLVLLWQAAEPAWDPTADALVEMKDEEEEEEEEVQLASVHTSCRQGDDNRNNNNAAVHHNSLSDGSAVSTDYSVTSVITNKVLDQQQNNVVLSSTPQNKVNDSNVTVISNDNNDTNDNTMSLYPSDLSLNDGDIRHLGSDLNNSESSDSASSQELSSDSEASEDGTQSSNPRPQLKLNTAIQPLSPPLGKSPGISQSKGKLKLKAKKNSKSKKWLFLTLLFW